MYQNQAQPVQWGSSGGGWKALQLLSSSKPTTQKPLTVQQQMAFKQGAGPVSQAGAEHYLNNSFDRQIWDGYQGFQGMPSIYERLMRGGY